LLDLFGTVEFGAWQLRHDPSGLKTVSDFNASTIKYIEGNTPLTIGG